MEPLRFEGLITSWNDGRGFGFIEATQGGQEIFVHIKAFASRQGRPQVGQRVCFEIEPGPGGRKRACNVETVRPAVRAAPRARGAAPLNLRALAAIPAFALLYLAVGVAWGVPAMLAVVYLGMSAFTFVVYALDKSAAERGLWRVAEATLHMLALACGWPGALLAQQVLRHKSSKAGFQVVFWASVAVNVAVFVGWWSPLGRRLWQV